MTSNEVIIVPTGHMRKANMTTKYTSTCNSLIPVHTSGAKCTMSHHSMRVSIRPTARSCHYLLSHVLGVANVTSTGSISHHSWSSKRTTLYTSVLLIPRAIDEDPGWLRIYYTTAEKTLSGSSPCCDDHHLAPDVLRHPVPGPASGGTGPQVHKELQTRLGAVNDNIQHTRESSVPSSTEEGNDTEANEPTGYGETTPRRDDDEDDVGELLIKKKAAASETMDHHWTPAVAIPSVSDFYAFYDEGPGTCLDYVREGLVAMSQREAIVNAAYGHVCPPPPPAMSREERYKQRQNKKEWCWRGLEVVIRTWCREPGTGRGRILAGWGDSHHQPPRPLSDSCKEGLQSWHTFQAAAEPDSCLTSAQTPKSPSYDISRATRPPSATAKSILSALGVHFHGACHCGTIVEYSINMVILMQVIRRLWRLSRTTITLGR
ncbi:hypothetical protein B0J13DRAFT_607241 [Dactylonectria estremocensis]|uniref:Uncharacterized protein n=1 Tax=Dactylonectria estremocensis TaxID=1079267 RepID=A0A9P9J6Z4_9HYPO|nr:hypothetical protein B0J13DRAFT_607241 [Dactylonectria estremocensis]